MTTAEFTEFTDKAIRGAVYRSLVRASRHADWIEGSWEKRADVLLRELAEDLVTVAPAGPEGES